MEVYDLRGVEEGLGGGDDTFPLEVSYGAGDKFGFSMWAHTAKDEILGTPKAREDRYVPEVGKG